MFFNTSDIQYNPVISREIWPSDNYEMEMKGFTGGNNQNVSNKDIGVFVVYFQELSYTSIVESPAYEIQEFISDIGGILGLYVGFSILTIVEYFELALDVLKIGGHMAQASSKNVITNWKKAKKRKLNPSVSSSRTAGNKNKNEMTSLTLIWNEFYKTTSSHGIPHIGKAKSKKYFEKPVETLVKFDYNHNLMMPFPAVTLCNNNPIKKSVAIKYLDYKNLMKNFSETMESVKCQRNKFSVPHRGKDSKTGNCTTTCDQKPRCGLFFLNLFLEKHYEKMDFLPKSGGHEIENIVQDCSFNGVSCRHRKDFDHFVDIRHGNCYIFNSAMNGKKFKNAQRSGPLYGLSITFNVDQNEYIGKISQSAGLRVVVHDPKRMPYPEDEGILVSPNTLTHIGVNAIFREKLGDPYGDCYEDGVELDRRSHYQTLYGLNYDEKGCFRTCMSKIIYDKCQCNDMKFSKDLFPNGTKLCSVTDDSTNHCIEEILRSFENETFKCDPACTSACKLTHSTVFFF
ncbi:hypothetical protein HELRODRAFT_168360 [Helobdella robusta]|uniref:Uncharacterized protein n=1 Tax=Helobdella robusta TaxID=6412 RepID=T1F0G9_HELRO|nr:hypothetical protein HELRODRAFT_168360 [Helobdella robusta]ESO09379.1 hypothetical protein HELRODRAFT_168360 [Helobdella robusta]